MFGCQHGRHGRGIRQQPSSTVIAVTHSASKQQRAPSSKCRAAVAAVLACACTQCASCVCGCSYGGRLPERQAVEMVLQPFLHVLHYLHQQGILHR